MKPLKIPTATQRIFLLAKSYREPDDYPPAWRRPKGTWLQKRLIEIKGRGHDTRETKTILEEGPRANIAGAQVRWTNPLPSVQDGVR